MKKVKISATTHPCPVENLEEYINVLQNLKIDYVHFDIMDGRFVEDKTFDYKKIAELLTATKIKNFSIHLMAKCVNKIIDNYIALKPDSLTIHYEAFRKKEDLISCLTKIKKAGVKAGVAINPQTKVIEASEAIKIADKVLVMSVEPGKSGQKFNASVLEKISQIETINKKVKIELDGGINDSNIMQVISAGADGISMGSFMYNAVVNGTAKTFLEQF